MTDIEWFVDFCLKGIDILVEDVNKQNYGMDFFAAFIINSFLNIDLINDYLQIMRTQIQINY